IVPQRHDHARERAHARPWRDDPRQIQWIGRRYVRGLGRGSIAPYLPKQLDRFRTRKLLADEAGDESTAANLSLSLHAPERDEKIAPCGCNALARKQVPEHDAPSQQQLPRDRLQRRLTDDRADGLLCLTAGPSRVHITWMEQGPATWNESRPPGM